MSIHTGMMFCRVYEVPALDRGVVSITNPRQKYVALHLPALATDIPPLWSLFHPINASSSMIYENPIPNREAILQLQNQNAQEVEQMRFETRQEANLEDDLEAGLLRA